MSAAAAAATENKKKNLVYVIGVHVTKFVRPSNGAKYDDLGAAACVGALSDAGIDYSLVQAAVASYCYGDPAAGQRVIYRLGLSGIPIINVNNNCSSGSTALFTANQFVKGGLDCVLAVGFEQMREEGIANNFTSTHGAPTEAHFRSMYQLGASKEAFNPKANDFTADVVKLFGEAQKEHMIKYGSQHEHYCQIAYKNHKQSVGNQNALHNREVPLEAITKSKQLYGPILASQACPISSGAAAVVVCSEAFVERHGLHERAVEIVAQSMVTDVTHSFSSFINLTGFLSSQQAANNVYRESGLCPFDVDVVELHNCFSCNELLQYEALGLAPVGSGHVLVAQGKWQQASSSLSSTSSSSSSSSSSSTSVSSIPASIPGHYVMFPLGNDGTVGSRMNGEVASVVVNPSGGIECRGHPIGATGLAQSTELVRQLRGECGVRQVKRANIALQQNFGLGSAAVVTLYRRPKQLLHTTPDTIAVHGATSQVGTAPTAASTPPGACVNIIVDETQDKMIQLKSNL